MAANGANRVFQMAVNLAPAAIGGAVQRIVYENNENYGFLTTGGFILGGTLLSMFGRKNDLLGRAGDGMIASGASILGWVGTEIMFLNKRPSRPAMIPQRQMPTPQQAYAPPAYRAALGPGQAHHNFSTGIPQVALQGLNPNTGETILSSRV